MKKVKLKAKLFVSPNGNKFWVKAVNYRFEEAIGIGTGLHYAINDFIECFNELKYRDKDGVQIVLDETNIIKPERPFDIRHVYQTVLTSHRDYLVYQGPRIESVGMKFRKRTPEEMMEGMPVRVRSLKEIQAR